MDDLIFTLKALLGVFAIMVAFVAPIIFGVNAYNHWQCNNFALLSGQETRYVSFDECYVKAGDSYIRYTEYEKRAIAQNLKGD